MLVNSRVYAGVLFCDLSPFPRRAATCYFWRGCCTGTGLLKTAQAHEERATAKYVHMQPRQHIGLDTRVLNKCRKYLYYRRWQVAKCKCSGAISLPFASPSLFYNNGSIQNKSGTITVAGTGSSEVAFLGPVRTGSVGAAWPASVLASGGWSVGACLSVVAFAPLVVGAASARLNGLRSTQCMFTERAIAWESTRNQPIASPSAHAHRTCGHSCADTFAGVADAFDASFYASVF
jgi:hypothetical protein